MKKLSLFLIISLVTFVFIGCERREYIPAENPSYEYNVDDDLNDDIVIKEPAPEPKPEPEPEPEPTTIRIQFVGDILLHPRYTGSVETARIGPDEFYFKPFLRDVKDFIDGDLSIANLETPVDVMGNNQDLTTFPWFNVPFEILPALVYSGFDHLIFGNNHTVDRGFDGMIATIDNLESVGLQQTGAYPTMDARNTPTIIDVEGVQVGIIAYTDSLNGNDWMLTPEQNAYVVRRFRSHVLDDVPSMIESANWLREQGAEVVIMSLHWGAEYVNHPTETQRIIARQLVEGGVDIIMGNHAHVVQPVEWYYREDGSRGFIIYSLGNFLADQTRLNPPIEPTQFGKLVTVAITRSVDGVTTLDDVEILPTLTMRDWAGDTLRFRDDISVLPLIEGELPDFITNQSIRDWGRRAYNHVVGLVGEEFVTRRLNDQ